MRVPPYYTGIDGAELLEVAGEHRLEGVVSKLLDSLYRSGQCSRDWTKAVLRTIQEVVIGGWRTGKGRALGALIMGACDAQGRLRYVGVVGSGFTEAMLRQLRTRLAELAVPVRPFSDLVDATAAHCGAAARGAVRAARPVRARWRGGR